MIYCSGVHHTQRDCNSNVIMRRVKSILHSVHDYLFPSK